MTQQFSPVQTAVPRRRRFQAFAAALTLAGALLTLPVSPVSAANEPNTPTLSFVTATSNSVRLSWTAPATNGAPITRYELRRGATLVSAAITATTLTYTNSGLSSGSEYGFTLKACSSGGCSAASSVLTAPTLPAAATNVTGVAGEGSVTVTWTDSPAAARRSAQG